ncbi:hypothetical protein ACFYKX_02820 [Cytobacillus sp. FJAT-54145]|uniref:AMP-dependent synthetase and ligase n=1 Tax=Cytobacillus spartinae TaxID=3299023 RepID=A0ABW6K5T8_9BACI
MHTTQHGIQQINQCRQMAQQLIHQTEQGNQKYRQMLQQEQQNVQVLEQILQSERQAVQSIQQSLQDHQTAIQRCQEIIQVCNQMQQELTGQTTMNNQAMTSYQPIYSQTAFNQMPTNQQQYMQYRQQ